MESSLQADAREKLLRMTSDRDAFRRRMAPIQIVALTAMFTVFIGAFDRAYRPFARFGIQFDSGVEAAGYITVLALISLYLFQIGTEIFYAKRIVEAQRILDLGKPPNKRSPRKPIAEILKAIFR